jgi:hypothetical protein
MFKQGLIFTSLSECFPAYSCPTDKKGMKEIYKWQNSLERCPIQLDNIIIQQLAATKTRYLQITSNRR